MNDIISATSFCNFFSSYLRCFYWAVRTVSTIHELEENNPTNTLEFTVEMFAYLGGVFVIAVIIGEVSTW